MKLLLILLCILMISCSAETSTITGAAVTCPASTILVGGECCPDNNHNQICDENEAKEEKKVVYASLAEVESGINRSFYPLKRYNFSDVGRENITGIENLFEIRESKRFDILKIKNKYDYLSTPSNFSDFIQRLYDLKVKNTNIAANSHLESEQLLDSTWEDVIYNYNPKLEEVSSLEKPAFIETHNLLYERNGGVVEIGAAQYFMHMLCTPELVIEIYPSESLGFYYSDGNTIDVMNKRISDLQVKSHETIIDAAKKIVRVCDGKVDEPTFSAGEVVFYGPDGFYPEELHIKKGEKVIVHNENSKWEGIALLFVREKPKKFINSKIIKIGETGEITINEPGTYTFFVTEYAPRAKVTVE